MYSTRVQLRVHIEIILSSDEHIGNYFKCIQIIYSTKYKIEFCNYKHLRNTNILDDDNIGIMKYFVI